MSNFEPDPDKPYATCSTCGVILADREAMKAHFKGSTPPQGGKSHSARITNPTRIERIAMELDSLVKSALYGFVDGAERLLDDVTEAEVTEAMRSVYGDFTDAWRNRDE